MSVEAQMRAEFERQLREAELAQLLSGAQTYARPAPPAAADLRPEPPAERDNALSGGDEFSAWPDGRIDNYFETEPPPVTWFCEDRLLAGRGHLLVAIGGTSKTRMLYQLGVGAVVGRLPWNWNVQATGSAALFLTEDTTAQVHRVMHQLGQRLNPDERDLVRQRLRVFPLAGLRATILEMIGNTLIRSPVYDWMRRQIDTLPVPPALVGIDPALGVSEGDELSQSHQRRLGELVDHLAIATGACAILSSHAGKGVMQGAELQSHTSRGGGAITDAVRGEFVLRTMTADEARKYGITDIAERRRYLQLVGTKGNELPPEAFVPVWLRRDAVGVQQVTLDEVERGTVGPREREALALLVKSTEGGETTMKFWREDCIAAGIIRAQANDEAQVQAMKRIRDALLAAGLIERGTVRGAYVPV